MTDQVTKLSDSEQKKEDWMNAKWRPMMGWMYMLVCTCDFIVFPVLWSLLHAILHTGNIQQWNPLTLQGAGLFHIAMGAVLGLAAFGRTQEKIAGANNGGASFGTPAPSFSSPAPAPSFGAPSPAPSFGAPTQTTVTQTFSPAPAPAFGSPAPAVNASGKKVVPQFDQPEL
jgi:hypothetical protein